MNLSTLIPKALRVGEYLQALVGEYLQALLEESIRAFQGSEKENLERKLAKPNFSH
jgi:hypothetical protein